jgi:hypothetical protein
MEKVNHRVVDNVAAMEKVNHRELAESGFETRKLEREGEDDRLGELHAEGGPQPTSKLSTL